MWLPLRYLDLPRTTVDYVVDPYQAQLASVTRPSYDFGHDYHCGALRLVCHQLHPAVCYAKALAPFVCPGQLRSCRSLEEMNIDLAGNAPLDLGRIDVPVLFRIHLKGRLYSPSFDWNELMEGWWWPN